MSRAGGGTDRLHRPTARPRPADGGAGFTLLEMLVVVLVLSLMVGLVVSRGPSQSPTLDARAAAGRLVQALRTARVAAITGSAPVRLEVDLARQSLASTAPGVTMQMPPSVRLSYVTAAGRAVDAGRAVVTFAPDGSSSGGALAVSSQSARDVVAIDPFTGRVEARGG